MRASLTGKILRILSTLVLLVLAIPQSVAAGPEDIKPKPGDAPVSEGEIQAKETRQIKLITGDLVTVTIMTDGKRSLSISPADPNRLGQRFLTFEQGGSTYVMPDGVNLEKLDMELFNVDYLLDEEYDKEPVLPLLVSYQSTMSAPQIQSFEGRVQALSMETKPLHSVSAIAASLAYGSIASSYQNIVSQPEVKKIWLNKKVHATLAESIPLIGAPSWWEAGYTGNGAKIAILDTGIDSAHPSLDDLEYSVKTTDILTWSALTLPSATDNKVRGISSALPSIIAVSPDGGTIFATHSTNGTVYRSMNGGVTFSQTAGTGTPGWNDGTALTFSSGVQVKNAAAVRLTALAVSPTFALDKTVVVATAALSGGVPNAGLYKSTDGGVNFIQITANLTTAEQFTSIALSPSYATDGLLVAATRIVPLSGFAAAATGNAYQLGKPGTFGLNAIVPAEVRDFFAIAFSPSYASDRTIVAVGADATDTRVLVNVNWGTAWGSFAGMTDGGAILPGTTNVTLSRAALALPSDFQGFDTAKRAAYVARVVTDGSGNVTRSSFGATTATTADIFPSTEGQIHSLSYSGTTAAGTLLAGAHSGTGVFRVANPNSSTTFANWIAADKLPTGSANVTVVVAPDFATSKKVYAMTEGKNGGFAASTDSGAVFTEFSLINTSVNQVKDFVPSPNYNVDRTIFMVTTDNGTADADSVWHSPDGGTTWHRYFSVASANDALIVRLSPAYATDKTVIVAETGAIAAGNSRIWKSTNGGITWTMLLSSMAVMNDVVVEDSNTFYEAGMGRPSGSASAVATVLKSVGGADFSVTPTFSSGLSGAPWSLSRASNGDLFAGTTDGRVYRSTDKGLTYASLPSTTITGISNPNVAGSNVVVVPDSAHATNKVIYAISTSNVTVPEGATAAAGGQIQRLVVGTSTAWEVIYESPQNGPFGGIAISADGVLYVADSSHATASNGGILRSLNPAQKITELAGPVFSRASTADGLTSHNATTSISFVGLSVASGNTTTGNTVFAIDQAVSDTFPTGFTDSTTKEAFRVIALTETFRYVVQAADPKVVVNVNFSTDNDTMDRHGHGTHVAGTAAGTAFTHARSGEYAWFSGAADNLDNTLTRAFDLTAVNSTSLRFWTKYDMEVGWDYGYLKISTDNGTTWTTLATYNGVSANLSGFTQLSYDLSSNFTGRNILVRFQYITDGSVVRMGWYIDDVDITGISFTDDAESNAANWTSVGWTRARMVTQGVAPGARLWNVKVLNQWGYGYQDQIINGINFASLGPDGIARTGDEADIISMSLGGGGSDGTDPMSQSVNLAVERGVVVVVAAGNSGPNRYTVSAPGVAEKAITVGATAKDDTLAYFSSRGPTLDFRLKPDIVAPGVQILSAKAGGGVTSMSGTSMATPHVAGAAALLRQRYADNATPQFIKDALMYTAKDLSLSIYDQGSGRLNLALSSWSKIGVTPASRNLGIFSTETVASGNFTFFNTDNVSHAISLSANLTADNITGPGQNFSAAAVLSPASFVLPASGNITVSISANLTTLPTGRYSGRMLASVDNASQIHAIFGFHKLWKVTMLKTNIWGAQAERHLVWVAMAQPQEEMLVSGRYTDASGNLTIYLPGGVYNLISPNWWAANVTDIWTIAENVTVSGNTLINLDERNTKVVDFNPNRPGLVPSARNSTLYYRTSTLGWWGWRTSWWYPQAFAARVSPIRAFDAGFNYNAYPESDFVRDGAGLVNSDEWLNLLYSVDNITDNVTFTADYPNLVRRLTRYGVALKPEKAYLYQQVSDNVSWWSSGFGYGMNAPRTRTEWLSPTPAQYYQDYSKYTYEPGNLWDFQGWFNAQSGNYTSLIGVHPLSSGLFTYIWQNYPSPGRHRLNISGPISKDQSGNYFYNYAAQYSGNITVTQNGTFMLFQNIRDSFWVPLDFTGTANFTVEVWGRTPLELSPTSYTRLDFVADPSRDSRAPEVYPRVNGISNLGIVSARDIVVRVAALDQSAITSVQLAYRAGDSGNWTDAGTPTFSGGEYYFDLGTLQDTFVSLNVTAADQYGNRITRVTNRAFYVGSPGIQVKVNTPPTVVPSANFTATVDITGVANLDAANYDIVVDPAVLSLVDVQAGSVNGTAIPVDIWNPRGSGRYTIVQNVPGLSGASGNGTLATLRFQVLGAYGTSSNISLQNGMLSDNASQGITAAWFDAQVTATGIPGDATGDSLIDSRDITKVERIIAHLDPQTPGADANKDGSINAVDITKVERLIAGLN